MLRIFMFFLLIIITTNRPFMNCVDLFQSETLIWPFSCNIYSRGVCVDRWVAYKLWLIFI